MEIKRGKNGLQFYSETEIGTEKLTIKKSDKLMNDNSTVSVGCDRQIIIAGLHSCNVTVVLSSLV